MNIPTFPDLDASSDDGSVDKAERRSTSSATTTATTTTTATANIKPGGEDNDPRPPMRSVSPSPPSSVPHPNHKNSSNSSGGSKLASHRKMSQKTRLLSHNPLDAFEKSPEKPKDGKQQTAMASSSTAKNSNSNNSNSKNHKDTRARSPPPMSMSSGAAKALRRGVPASEARGLNGPLRRLPPNRSNLKKSSSFNEGVKKKSSLAGGANQGGNSNDGEPTRGLTRRASMGSSRTTTIEVRVRGERFPVQRRRSINFDQRVEIKEVEPVTSLVGNNCSEIWLQEEDFAKMKQDRRNLVHKVKKSGGTLPTKETLETGGMRGLEKYVDKSIRAAKNLAWDTVLLEQDEQELSGDYNEERIADLYRHFTRESPDKAVARAKQDEQDVQDYLWSPRTTKLMLRRLPPMVAVAAAAVGPPVVAGESTAGSGSGG
eukprot:CAMPEP_0117007024 /NCGR_PEP_ID=MMETSP0472-20121206/7048_1 /TAXON_ID=693140 ORGANISM="Tiarina fusus, Strain LIS" /NCGR_SAMPLE_ID=MMETSP0472 /ASSEMBLY_ACC=CAM_ASM_000603 /LENGTH=428 /DNA_ID=CAMNT_0004708667 /DNA_START=308 /DNA_END=1590 /DNA_ORIENTATION=-